MVCKDDLIKLMSVHADLSNPFQVILAGENVAGYKLGYLLDVLATIRVYSTNIGLVKHIVM